MKAPLRTFWIGRLLAFWMVAAVVSMTAQLVGAPAEKAAGAGLVGKPLAIKFAAVDGRQVDLGNLRGKVVLIDFWATWCVPCVHEVPHVKAVYDKLHPKGFEIVGISFDQKKTALQSFVLKEKMTWPQYFDGKGWENQLCMADRNRSPHDPRLTGRPSTRVSGSAWLLAARQKQKHTPLPGS